MDLPVQATLIGRMALGAFLGYVIGFEREYRGKSAGERTFGLLALRAAAVTGVGALFFPLSAEKVIAGVITGVGFLGAGLIFRERDMTGQGQVLGLTTAASSWAAAAGRDPRGGGRLLRCRYGVRHHPGDPRDQPLAALPQDLPREGAPRRGDRWL
jgi:putative Mg2+ transporter-C (MgtC) family protein